MVYIEDEECKREMKATEKKKKGEEKEIVSGTDGICDATRYISRK
jgi:hypothetical protein